MTELCQRLGRALLVVGSALFMSSVARAEDTERAAEQHYERGMKAYDLGRFDEAITSFEHAYEISNDPILLFNLAQAHRRAGALERALFFYRRFLALAATSPVREKAEQRIAEIEHARAEEATAAARTEERPPTEGSRPAGAGMPAPAPSEDTLSSKPRAFGHFEPGVDPHTRLHLAAGAADLAFVGSVPEASLAPILRLEIDRDLGAAALRAFAGAGVSAATFSYAAAVDDNRSWLYGALVHVGVRQTAGDGLWLAARAGIGVMWWQLPDGSAFTPAGTRATGPLALPTWRVAAGSAYALTQRASVTLEAGFSYARPLDERLADATESLRQGDVLAGLEVGF